MLLSAQSITKTYGTRVLLDHVSLYLEAGELYGVVGVNGAGKSTLLRLLAGAEEPETGEVTRFPNVRLEYLPQNPSFAPGVTVLEQVLLGLSSDARALAEYEAKTILTRLGITRFDQMVEELSGGQKKRVALAAALARPCDVLILDEPTNHLDSEMITWLEEWLQRFSGGLVMITHDRYFLERVTNRIAEVDGGQLYFYEGSYEDFLRRKAEREESAKASERKRQSILRREYQWVMQGPKARGTKSRERLERYEALKNQTGPAQRATLELSSLSSRLGKKTIELRGVSKAFEGRMVLRDFSCMLLRDDRIGIVGVNGSGKSTLLNLIAGRLAPDAGEVLVGETVKIGYFSQENPPMDPNIRVIDYVKEIGERIETPDGVLTASQLLEQFLFPADVQWSPIGKLSGGEKRRLFLLSILAAAPNILLLDEPTNDLDIETLTILEDYLETFQGAVVAVSHDRYFLDKVAARIFVVEGNGQVTPYAGGYTDYLEALAQRRKEEKKAQRPAEKKETPRSTSPQKLKFSYKEQREYETIEDEIAALEEQLAANRASQSQCGSDYLALQTLQEEEGRLEQTLEEKMERWEYLSDLAERIAAQ
ncbi:MAG TPA: ABC-F family ATP-binding cassette domain-containing protein [Candidatus Flavonifractor merdigallinarum]|uniref:ABC-F family ATP-binding cassette domain-containing protein n=1 Tax=Candidatus Flavonifractor merdigallinarum TaxID=2838589 RepID=A0A9D2BY29_9FIRM|nr:ABC-F family ATP-binding cassette domain-containing protein [Candidatus Flavonifractor merdigallinarum]